MATVPPAFQGGRIMVNVFDGARQLIAPGTELLLTIKDGNQNQISRNFYQNPSTFFTGLPIFNNFGDDYTVLASSDDYKDAGFFPVHVAPNVDQIADLMLVPKQDSLNFSGASWQKLGQVRPSFQSFFAKGAADAAAAQQRYGDLEETQEGELLACLLNITTAMSQILLPQGNALQYLKMIAWDRIAQDRFFAFADPALVDQVKLAVGHGEFAPASYALHPGATSSYKQIQFGEANVQLTFHENDRQDVDGQTCILVEPDMDYYRDLGAHFILEVVVNAFGSLTDPRAVYVLRWIAGRRAGLAEFDPLYTIVKG
jgi:hypothetical protein